VPDAVDVIAACTGRRIEALRHGRHGAGEQGNCSETEMAHWQGAASAFAAPYAPTITAEVSHHSAARVST
jgi:hypothetical protein